MSTVKSLKSPKLYAFLFRTSANNDSGAGPAIAQQFRRDLKNLTRHDLYDFSPSLEGKSGALPPRMTTKYEDTDWHEQSKIDAPAYDRGDADFSDTDDVKEFTPTRTGHSKARQIGKVAKDTYETSNSSLPHRPNRWKGSNEKWRRLTRPERDLIDQLDELENRDWAKGLYGAYLIKERRRRRLENNQESRARNTQADWTAWPLYPEDIAQADDRIEYKLQKQRESSTSPRRSQTRPAKVAHIDPHGRHYNAAPKASSSDSSSDDDSLSDPPSIADTTEIAPSYNPHVFKAKPDLRPSSSLEEIVIAQMMKTGKERFRERTSKPGFQSAGYTLSADDELMATQLRPMARNVITQFENLLLGMHQRAENGRPGRRHRMRANSETSYGYGTSVKSSRKGSKVKSENSDSGNDDTNTESAQESRGRSSKRGGSASTKGKGRNQSKAASSVRSISSQSQGGHVAHSPARKRMANRTWESVMLVASLQDWPEDVLDKANQRLEGIFGKSATLVPQRRDLWANHWDKSLVCPVPECPRHMEPFSESSDMDRHMRLIHGGKKSPYPFSLPASRSQSRSHSRAHGKLSGAEDEENPREWRRGMKGEYVDTNLVCPVTGCRRHKEPFSRLWNLKEHMRLRHPGVDLPESTQPPSKNTSQSRPRRTQSRPGSTSSRKYKSEDVVISTDEDRDSGREETRDSGKFYCPIKSCKRSINGFSRNWNLQKHLRLMHPAWRAENVG